MLVARLSWRLLAVLFVALGLGTVAYLLHGVTGMVETLQLRSSVADQLSGALPSVTAAVSEERDGQRGRRSELGDPRHSWTVLECEVAAREAGWRAGSHDQVCTVRAVDAYPADASDVPTCRTPRMEPRRVSPVVRVVQVPAGHGGSRCAEGLRRSEVRGPGLRLLDGSVPKRLDSRRAWLVVATSARALDVEVGCSSWTPVICRPPFADPVLP